MRALSWSLDAFELDCLVISVTNVQLVEEGLLHGRFAGLTVLELGAGAALPSLVLLAQQSGLPRAVVISDFDDGAIISAIEDNVKSNVELISTHLCRVVGHTWGTSTRPLTTALADILGCSASAVTGFDVILLADTLWDQQPHAELLTTLCAMLAPKGEVSLSSTSSHAHMCVRGRLLVDP